MPPTPPGSGGSAEDCDVLSVTIATTRLRPPLPAVGEGGAGPPEEGGAGSGS